MIYYILTIINCYGAIVTIGSLLCVLRNYFLPQKIEFYIFITIGSMAYVFFANAYILSLPARDWKLPVTSLLWCLKTLYFSYLIRDKGIKKS